MGSADEPKINWDDLDCIGMIVGTDDADIFSDYYDHCSYSEENLKKNSE